MTSNRIWQRASFSPARIAKALVTGAIFAAISLAAMLVFPEGAGRSWNVFVVIMTAMVGGSAAAITFAMVRSPLRDEEAAEDEPWRR